MDTYEERERARSRKNIRILVEVVVAILAVIAVIAAFACRATIGQGKEAVLIQKPFLFGHGGVDPKPVHTGVTWLALTTSKVTINTQPQLFNTEFNNVMSKDGVPVNFQMRLTLQVTDPVELVKNFGGADYDSEHANDWYKINIAPHLQYLMRTAAKQHLMNDLAISGSAADAVDRYVRSNLEQYIKEKRIPVKIVDVNAGRADPPDAVRDQRLHTAAEQQRKITEINTQQAEEARKGAEIARAEADKAYNDRMGLDTKQYVTLERIKMLKSVCTPHGKNATSPCRFFIGQTPSMIIGK